MSKKPILGRGLEALLNTSPRQSITHALQNQGELRRLPIEYLQPGKYQPRRDMSQQGLEELAESIRAQGIIQPIVVRPTDHERFEIIAGERRWRASQIAGLSEIPCLVKPVADEAAIAMSLIENIQREDLNVIDEALALQRLLEEFQLTHQDVAQAVGKSRTTVTNTLRLLSLNQEVRTLVEHGDLDMGHARALLGLTGAQQTDAARTVAAKKLSVRDTEKLVQKYQTPTLRRGPRLLGDPDIRHLEQTIGDILGAKVAIQHSLKGSGRLVIHYSSLDVLEGILQKIQKQAS